MSTFPQYTVKDVAHPVAAVGWTPAAYRDKLVSWHDASDVSTLDEVSGFVYRRLDKSGNGRHFEQSVPANRPAVGTNMDRYYAGDSMELPGYSAFYTTSPVYVVLVAKASYYSTTTPIIKFGNSPYGFSWELKASYGATLLCGSTIKHSWQTVSTYNAIYQAMFGAQNKYRVQSSYGNGSWTDIGVTLPVQTEYSPVIGGLSSGQTIDFYEMIAIAKDMTDDDIYLTTAYLAHKWDALLGIGTYVSRLDSANPFKTTLPIIQPTAAFPRMYDGVPGSIR